MQTVVDSNLKFVTVDVETVFHASCGIRTRNPSKRAAGELRLKLCGHYRYDHELKCIIVGLWRMWRHVIY
jgi:hypothetical protein